MPKNKYDIVPRIGFKPEYDLRRVVKDTYHWLKKTRSETLI